MKTNKMPPWVSTELAPADILGEAYQAYVDFVKNSHLPPNIRRKMDDEDRERATRLMDLLAESGFHLVPRGSGPELEWVSRTKSEVDMMVDAMEHQDIPIDEIKEMARNIGGNDADI